MKTVISGQTPPDGAAWVEGLSTNVGNVGVFPLDVTTQVQLLPSHLSF
jgi:hypothetical protein